MSKATASALVGGMLHGTMAFCRLNGISFDACLGEARKQFQSEVREQALAAPPTK